MRRNLTNFAKQLRQILNHWSLLVNSANVLHELLSFFASVFPGYGCLFIGL